MYLNQRYDVVVIVFDTPYYIPHELLLPQEGRKQTRDVLSPSPRWQTIH